MGCLGGKCRVISRELRGEINLISASIIILTGTTFLLPTSINGNTLLSSALLSGEMTIKSNLLDGIIKKEEGLEGYTHIICSIPEDSTHEWFLTSDSDFFIFSDGLMFKVLKDEL